MPTQATFSSANVNPAKARRAGPVLGHPIDRAESGTVELSMRCDPPGEACEALSLQMIDRRVNWSDVQELANVVLAHRIMLVPEAAGVGRSEIVADAIASTPAL